MDLSYSWEQQQLDEAVKRFAEQEYPIEVRRRLTATPEGFSREVWARFAELGWLAVALPEDAGGMGGSAIETMIVMEGIGRGLMLEPYLATCVLGAGAVLASGDRTHAQALLPGVGEGRVMLALAHGERQARYDLEGVATRAEKRGGAWVLDGQKTIVLHGAAADRLIVSARTAGGRRERAGITLFVVDPATPGVSRRPYPTIDGLRAAEVTLEQVQLGADAALGTVDDGLAAVEAAVDRGLAALAAEAVGCMTMLHDQTLDYLKTREQFGSKIGRFQALQHRMVDVFMACEQARSMACLGAIRAEDADARVRRRTLSAVKAKVGQLGRLVGQEAIQLHGGMGMTDELKVGNYFKRLTAIDQTLGDVDHHLEKFAVSAA
jgi:alkylation response protein AidB-like acyl-CoA dehydrogenase